MSKTEHCIIIAKVKDFYQSEVKDFTHIDNYCKKYHVNKLDYKNSTLQRMLGVSFFVQTLGISYEEIDKIYEYYKNIIDNM